MRLNRNDLYPIGSYLVVTTIPIESTFDRAVIHAKGMRLQDYLGEVPSYSNADYIFPDDKVIAELKCIEKDPMQDAAFQAKISRLLQRWADEGRCVVYGSTLDVTQIPLDCAHEFFDLLKSQLEDSFLKKANKQIRETKERLKMQDGRGLLLLANDGNGTLDPLTTFYILHHAFAGHYSSIDHVIYFTANMVLVPHLIAKNCFLWSNVKLDHREEINTEFLDRLRQAWIKEFEISAGKHIPLKDLGQLTPDQADPLRFKPPE